MPFFCVQAQIMANESRIGKQASLSDAMEMVNQASKIPSTIALNPLHADYFRRAWQFLMED